MAYRTPYDQDAAQPSSSYDLYNPYSNALEPHRAYDQGGYDAYSGGYRDEPFVPPAPPPREQYTLGQSKELLGQDKEDMIYRRPVSRSPSAVRAWRYNHQGNLWTKGGRGRCVGRFCCCGVMVFLFLLISIIMSLALWIRPPNVIINGVQLNDSQSAVQITNTGLTLNLAVNITVNNPNYFSVSFKEINVEITYPINNTDVGGGTARDVDFGSHTNVTWNFPFSLVYTLADDPSYKILVDLATKCGVIGGTQSDITVNYKITLGLRVAFITVSPVVSNQFRFACPLSASDLESLAKDAGIDLTSLGI